VIRGGSWNSNARNVRAAYRNRNAPGNADNNLGFRPLNSAFWLSSQRNAEQRSVRTAEIGCSKTENGPSRASRCGKRSRRCRSASENCLVLTYGIVCHGHAGRCHRLWLSAAARRPAQMGQRMRAGPVRLLHRTGIAAESWFGKDQKSASALDSFRRVLDGFSARRTGTV